MNKIVVLAILYAFTSSSAMADICGHVVKGSKNAQLIPIRGKVKVQLVTDDVLSCGASLITHEDTVWIELADLTVFKIAPHSFFEFSKKESSLHKLYRGEVMVSAPPSIREFELTTPNSISVFHGGVVLLRYTPEAKETTLASFNRKIEFKNKFHPSAQQVVSAGEMSRLWIGESRLVPTQPEVMNPNSVKTAFAGFSLPVEEMNELIAIAERTISTRSKALVADFESWEDIEKDTTHSVERTVASHTKNNLKVESSIDPKEADIGLTLMKKRLYGDEEDQKMFNDSRKPASVHAEKLDDVEYKRKKAKESVSMKKVLENIRNFDPDKD